MPQWVDAKWTQCLCQVVRGKRGSLSLSLSLPVSLCNVCLTGTFIPQCWRERERDGEKKISAVDSALMLILLFWVFFLIKKMISALFCHNWSFHACVFGMRYVSDNGDAGVAAAAPADNRALMLYMLGFACVCVCVYDANVKAVTQSKVFGMIPF